MGRQWGGRPGPGTGLEGRGRWERSEPEVGVWQTHPGRWVSTDPGSYTTPEVQLLGSGRVLGIFMLTSPSPMQEAADHSPGP